jgi:hypothetical protein
MPFFVPFLTPFMMRCFDAIIIPIVTIYDAEFYAVMSDYYGVTLYA